MYGWNKDTPMPLRRQRAYQHLAQRLEAEPRLASSGKSLRRIAAIIANEVRLQRRGPVIWIVIVLVIATAIAASFTQATAPGKLTGDAFAAVAVTQYVIVVTILLAPFLLFTSTTRDEQHAMCDVLWIRPVSPPEYALGRTLAVMILGWLIEFLALTVGWIGSSFILGHTLPLSPWLALLPSALAATALAITAAFLCITVAPAPILGALVSSAFFAYITIFNPQAPTSPLGLLDTSAFYSPTIGFGPDGALITSQRLVFVLVALLCLIVSMLVALYREHRGATSRYQRFDTFLTMLLVVALAITATTHLIQTADNMVRLGAPPTQPTQANITGDKLAVTVLPHSSEIDGQASFVAQSDENDTSTLTFALNSGLRVSSVMIHDTAISESAVAPTVPVSPPFRSDRGWIQIDVSHTDFIQHIPILVTITYAGQLILNRTDYAPTFPSIGLAYQQGPDTLHSYIGHDIAFLGGHDAGNWYPLPWTQQTLVSFDSQVAFDDVLVRVPTTFHIYGASALSHVVARAGWWIIEGQPHHALPSAFLAALAVPHEMSDRQSALVYAGAPLSSDAIALDERMMQQASVMDTWLGIVQSSAAQATQTDGYIGVVVPLLRHPVLGSGIIFLPEVPDSELTGLMAYSATAQYRAPARDVALAWWLNHLDFQGTPPTYSIVPSNALGQSASTVFSSTFPTLLALLADFSAAVLTDRAIGHGYLTHERSVWTALYANTQESGQATNNDSPQFAAMNLGIACCADIALPLVLFDVEQHIGATKLQQLLREFTASYPSTPASLDDLIATFTPLMDPHFRTRATAYICPGATSVDNLSLNTCQATT